MHTVLRRSILSLRRFLRNWFPTPTWYTNRSERQHLPYQQPFRLTTSHPPAPDPRLMLARSFFGDLDRQANLQQALWPNEKEGQDFVAEFNQHLARRQEIVRLLVPLKTRPAWRGLAPQLQHALSLERGVQLLQNMVRVSSEGRSMEGLLALTSKLQGTHWLSWSREPKDLTLLAKNPPETLQDFRDRWPSSGSFLLQEASHSKRS
jgi:hypothetical protein